MPSPFDSSSSGPAQPAWQRAFAARLGRLLRAEDGRVRRGWVHALAAVVLAGMFALMTCHYREDSPTEDEWAHTIRGISYWQQSDTRLYYSHPPLGNALTGLALAFDDDNPDVSKTKAWGRAEVGQVALEYLRADYPAARDKLMRTRLAAMVIAALGGVYLYFFCLGFFGPVAALAGLVLYAFNPTIIAQARHVTTDLLVAIASMIAVGELVRYLTGRGRFALWTMALGLSAAVLTKHSGLLLVPFFVVIGAVVAALGRGRFAGLRIGRRLGLFALHGLVTALVLLLASNVVFKFDRTGLTVAEILEQREPTHWIYSPHKQQVLEKYTPLAKLPAGLRLPLPVVHIQGVAGIRAYDEHGFPSYFWGEPQQKGHPLYFPALLLFKSPPALLLLVGLALAIAVRRRLRVSLASAVIAGVGSLFLLLCMRSQINMGIRHALPILPLATILAAQAFAAAWAWAAERELLRLALAALLASTLISAASVAPLYLGYFNMLVGSERGHDISIYGEDWGQDRAALAKFIHKYELSPLYYDPQTSTRKLEMDHFDVDFTPLKCKTEVKPGSWVAIHAFPFKRNRKRCYPWARGLEPVVRLHEHVYLFWVPPGGKERKAAKPDAEVLPDASDEEGGLE